MSTKVPRQTTVDVVVVGGGGSGLSAAIEAASLGRSVVLLEKNPKLGGSTAWSVGSVSATSTPHQIAQGIKDRPGDHFEDLERFAGALAPRDNPILRKLLVDNVSDTFRWLMALGIEFYGPMPEPPNRRPRMHNVLPHSRSFIYHLAKEARRRGVDTRTDVRAQRLLTSGGRVTGVEAERGGRIEHFRARGGVILATGDFGGNPAMKQTYISAAASLVDAVNVHNTGDGHGMALALGARIVNGDLVHGPEVRFVPPCTSLVHLLPPVRPIAILARCLMEHAPAALLRPFLMSFLTTTLAPSRNLFKEGAVLVNKNGDPCATDHAAAGLSLAQQPGKIGYIVFDGAVAKKFRHWPHFISTAPGIAYAYLDDYQRSRSDIFHKADTVAALASHLGMNEGALAGAIGSQHTPPFYALGPVKSYIIFTDGGLAVDERLRVLSAGDRPIPGLFAAGATGQGGLLLEGHGHHLGWAFTSGLIAGRNAALEAVTEPVIAAGSGTEAALTSTTISAPTENRHG